MLALKLRHLVDSWGGDGGDDDRLAALAEQLGTTMNEAVRLACRMAGRDSPLETTGPEAGGLIDHLSSDGPSPEQHLARIGEHRLRSEALKAALARLSPRERLVIHKRYYDDVRHTFEAIGHELGVSKGRVRQLEVRALDKLRSLLRAGQQSLAGL
jgi:RNA polymerase sigma-32 factor